ncbi:MAG: T9SS type A sorting domain-containing protein [Lewinellaceae bacterium]|nr:T9SS type A sorting domain-containing protein [Lewinellaceae bacterium]
MKKQLVFLLPLLILVVTMESLSAQIIAGTGEFTYYFLRTIARGQTEKAIKIDVDGDSVWDFRIYGSSPFPEGWVKSSSFIYMQSFHNRARACRTLMDAVVYPFNSGSLCACEEQFNKRWTGTGETILLGQMTWIGGGIWQKLSDKYIAIRIDENGKDVFGWLKFSQQVAPNGFWLALKGIGADTLGWKPILEVEEYIPPPELKQYEDVFIPEIIPPDTTDEGGDTTIVEPPPPPLVDSSLQAFPNPFGDELTVNLLGIKDIMRLELIDFNGRMVYQERFFKSEIVTIPTSYLPPGQYVLRVVRYSHPPSLIRVLRINPRE